MNKKIILKNFMEVRYLRKFNSRKKLEKYQAKKVREQLEYMREKSPYFHNLKFEKLEDLPYMDKSVMMANFNEMNTAGIDKDEALELAIKGEKERDFSDKLHGYSVGLSSGTSGHRGCFVLSDDEIATWVGGMLGKMIPRGKLLGNRVAFFLRADNNLYEATNTKVLKFRFFDILKPMAQNISDLQEYQPTVLVAPPSVLMQLARAIQDKELDISPIKVISVAEVLTDKDKKYFKRIFKQDIIYQVYQCTEGFLGYTCDCGSLHINEDVVYIEKEYIDKNRFSPVITDFIRKTQPIIRYRLNDILVEDKRPCPCGSKLLRLKRIEGRMDDVFILPGKDGKDVEVYPDFISRAMVYVPNISDYKVVQETKKRVTVYLDNPNKTTQKAVEKELKTLANKMNFVMPALTFKRYEADLTRKMKRVERVFK